MTTHPLKRADFNSTLEFAAAVRAWHLEHSTVQTERDPNMGKLGYYRTDNDDTHSDELARERQAMTGSMDYLG